MMPEASRQFIQPLSQLGVQLRRVTEATLQELEATTTRSDCYRCLLVEQGSAPLRLDFQPVQMATGMLLITEPGQLYQPEPQPGCTGWLLLAEPALVATAIRNALAQVPLDVPLAPLAGTELAWFQHVFQAVRP